MLSANVHQNFTPFLRGYASVVVRALAVTSALSLSLTLLVGCGGAEKKQPDVRAVVTAKARTCAEGSFRRLGPSRLAFAAIVRSQAVVSHRPGAHAFATFDRLNANHVPMIFSIRAAHALNSGIFEVGSNAGFVN